MEKIPTLKDIAKRLNIDPSTHLTWKTLVNIMIHLSRQSQQVVTLG